MLTNEPGDAIAPPTPEETAELMTMDTTAAMAAITPAEAEHLKAALAAMVDAKLAHFRDGDDDRATALGASIDTHLAELSRNGVILFGDVGDGISRVRMGLLLNALRRG